MHTRTNTHAQAHTHARTPTQVRLSLPVVGAFGFEHFVPVLEQRVHEIAEAQALGSAERGHVALAVALVRAAARWTPDLALAACVSVSE